MLASIISVTRIKTQSGKYFEVIYVIIKTPSGSLTPPRPQGSSVELNYDNSLN